MIKISSLDLQRDVDRYQNLAMQHPVAVTRNGEPSCVLLSAKEYHRLRRRDREVLAIEDFAEADADAVGRADPGPTAADHDHELISKE